MHNYLNSLLPHKKNFLFWGESGSGKTELAINFAMTFARLGLPNIHFFDMDQTKPLFRSRDVCTQLEEAGITFHCEVQHADAPTVPGGTAELLHDPQSLCVMDIGGNPQGARMLGRYAHLTGRTDAANFFVINPYRPWSGSIEAIDRTMTETLGAARVPLGSVAVICNPNHRHTTTVEDIRQGTHLLESMLQDKLAIACISAKRSLCAALHDENGRPLLPIDLYINYEWE